MPKFACAQRRYCEAVVTLLMRAVWGLPEAGTHVLEVCGNVASQVQVASIQLMSPIGCQGAECVGHGSIIIIGKPACMLLSHETNAFVLSQHETHAYMHAIKT